MSKNLVAMQTRLNMIRKRADEVLGFIDRSQFENEGKGPFIEDKKARTQSIVAAGMKMPMFEAAGVSPEFIKRVGTGWGAALDQYVNRFGCKPSDDMLANAHMALENLLTECVKPTHTGEGAAMFEAAGEEMSKSTGVMRLALFAALILPAQLGAATSDCVTFVPCERDESDIYELYNVASTKFGSYNIGDELDMQSAGVYSQLNRIYVLPAAQQPSGTNGIAATPLKFSIADHEGKAMPIRKGRVKLMIDRQPGNFDDGEAKKVYFEGKDAKGNVVSANGSINYQTGTVDIVFSAAPAKGVEVSVIVEIDIETDPSLIPLVNQAMRSWKVKPSQYVLASEHTVQSLMDAEREFGINLSSSLFTECKQWLSHEIDMTRLRLAAFYARSGGEWDIALPDSQQFESYSALISGKLHTLSTEMVNLTKTSGIRGGFAGQTAANYFKMLPSSIFQLADGYVQTPYVQFLGTLFGQYRIYEVPDAICSTLTKENCPFDTKDIIFYGRGESIGQAGLVSGDAVPAIPFVHATDKNLVNRTTMWGSAVNVVHPNRGSRYLVRLKLVAAKSGAIDPFTGAAAKP
ncbi:TPA: capsid protein [Enterobacter hormaechei subsp. xiangfangensis]|nr:capsid protein [Enterobacter hormaechei subsp. xiangfangensis]HAV1890635.1 capsid protein [Enterobacter hormaechei subsp. xiangfangensis]